MPLLNLKEVTSEKQAFIAHHRRLYQFYDAVIQAAAAAITHDLPVLAHLESKLKPNVAAFDTWEIEHQPQKWISITAYYDDAYCSTSLNDPTPQSDLDNLQRQCLTHHAVLTREEQGLEKLSESVAQFNQGLELIQQAWHRITPREEHQLLQQKVRSLPALTWVEHEETPIREDQPGDFLSQRMNLASQLPCLHPIQYVLQTLNEIGRKGNQSTISGTVDLLKLQKLSLEWHYRYSGECVEEEWED